MIQNDTFCLSPKHCMLIPIQFFEYNFFSIQLSDSFLCKNYLQHFIPYGINDLFKVEALLSIKIIAWNNRYFVIKAH